MQIKIFSNSIRAKLLLKISFLLLMAIGFVAGISVHIYSTDATDFIRGSTADTAERLSHQISREFQQILES